MREGQTISHYKILEQLGSGAMGVVCKAEDLLLHRFVALKYLSSSTLTDPTHKDSLLHEARAASMLDHPNICRVHQIEELPDGQIILVMGYYDGETLAARIKRGPLELTNAISVASQLLGGLDHAHRYGIIHRDVKPSNIIINQSDEVKIVDFGLAKRPQAAGPLTEAGVIVGTITYMAPEQVLCKSLDSRTDLWACGVVLYEMLTGSLPFQGESPYIVFDAILREDPLPLLEHRPDLPRALEAILICALSKDPTQRYQSAPEFFAELRPFLESPSDKIQSVSLGSFFKKFKGAGEADPSVVVLPFTSAEPGDVADYFCDGLTDEIITELSSVRSLRIICRTSAMRLKGTSDSPQKIATQLKVRYVLAGSVRLNKVPAGKNSIRVTAQLVDPQSDSLLWADKYTGTLEDVFAIQESISRQIVTALKVKLTPAEDRQMVAHQMPDPNAYRYYLMAKHEILNYTGEALARALEYIELGERLVGKNALLLSTKGQVYWQYVNAGISSDPEYLVKAKQCADEALRVDPESAHGFRLLGLISAQEGEMQKAIHLLKKSIAADPNDSDTLSWYSAICGLSGKAHAAMPIARRIREIDPLTPVYRFVPGLLFLMAGEFADALPPFDEAIELDPANSMLLWCRGQVLTLCHRNDEAIAQFKAIERSSPGHFFAQMGTLMQAALAGDSEASKHLATDDLKQIASCDPHYSWYMAQCNSLLADAPNALRWLETAMEKGFINYPMISRCDPLLENVRQTPGFDNLIKQIRARWENFEA